MKNLRIRNSLTYASFTKILGKTYDELTKFVRFFVNRAPGMLSPRNGLGLVDAVALASTVWPRGLIHIALCSDFSMSSVYLQVPLQLRELSHKAD